MTREELIEKLKLHNHWDMGDCDGWAEMHQDFYGLDLKGLNLSGLDFSWLNMSDCDFSNSNLENCNFEGCILYNTDFYHANIKQCNFTCSEFVHAEFTDADATNACFKNAYFLCCDFEYAELANADFKNAKMIVADNLSLSAHVPNFPMTCPEVGSFVGWKKCGSHIVKLLIPEDAKRSSSTDRKCRCNKATVLNIESIDGKTACCLQVSSNFNKNFKYKIGETVEVDDFCEDRYKECAPGIHFFINRQEAVDYDFR